MWSFCARVPPSIPSRWRSGPASQTTLGCETGTALGARRWVLVFLFVLISARIYLEIHFYAFLSNRPNRALTTNKRVTRHTFHFSWAISTCTRTEFGLLPVFASFRIYTANFCPRCFGYRRDTKQDVQCTQATISLFMGFIILVSTPVSIAVLNRSLSFRKGRKSFLWQLRILSLSALVLVCFQWLVWKSKAIALLKIY